VGARAYEYGGIRAAEHILRWAAFFDVVGWPWSYRSTDLGGMAPHFLLTIPALDCAWVSVSRTAKEIDHVVADARRELERARLEGLAVALGPHPLSPEVLGGISSYPRPAWEPLTANRAALINLRGLWREALSRVAARAGGRAPSFCPEKLGGTTLPDWRSRGEALARRWGSPDEVRDWGLLVAEIGQADALLAGVLAGVDKGELTPESLNIWLPAHSIRTALLRSMGSDPRKLVERVLGVQLQVLVSGP
jgi:hypothetical protein